MKVFISLPMSDKTNEEIKEERARIERYVTSVLETEENVEVIDSFFEDAPQDSKPLYYLGKSLELLSEADLVVFGEEWKEHRGCIIEYIASKYYNIPTHDLEEGTDE